MLTVTLTKGLPGSGKSTWAKQQVLAATNGAIKRVNKDDLRAMLDVSRWSKTNEQFVLNVRDFVIIEALLAGKHVIVDDTNLEDSHFNRISSTISLVPELKGKVKVQYQDFTDVDIELCIERDIKRANGVGEKVIRDMYERYLAPKPLDPPPYNPDLPDAIITDCDGTLSLNDGHRGWYEYEKVGGDKPNAHILDLVNRYGHDHQIIVVTGREDSCRQQTTEWLTKHKIKFDQLLMRPTDDKRQDAIVKLEIFNQYIRNKYNVVFVLDDRQQCVDLWRSQGLVCLAVAPGNF